MDIIFSRHAKRRMTLYEIDAPDVKHAIERGKKQIQPDGKIYFTITLEKLKYPLKVVIVEEAETYVIITAYPLKRMR